MEIWKDGGLRTSCQSSGFTCQQWLLKTFLSSDLRSQDGCLWLWNFLANLHLYGWRFYLPRVEFQWLVTIGMETGLSTPCHSCRFTSQKRVLKVLPGLRYIPSSSLPCTSSNHWAIWLYNEMCLIGYRIKWPQISSHCQVISVAEFKSISQSIFLYIYIHTHIYLYIYIYIYIYIYVYVYSI